MEKAETSERNPAGVVLKRLRCPKCQREMRVSPGLNPKCVCGAVPEAVGLETVAPEEQE